MDLSFIIPAYNEAENIKAVIGSIKQHVPEAFQYEVLVVDHGSADDTVVLAEACGAKVLVHSEGTVAGLRNFGVSHSIGQVLVFLDADILLTDYWGASIGEVVASLSNGERILTGSWCGIPDKPNWIEKFWFKPLEHGDNSHINSGHLIIPRRLFDEIDGFDATLETGEDYDISIRAKAANIQVLDDVKLRVIHAGYPKNLVEFAKRETWHGKGDATTLVALFQSKVAMTALLFVVLHLFLIFFCLVSNQVGAYVVATGIACIVIGSAYLKYRAEPVSTILVNCFIYYVYFWARGFSIISLFEFGATRKRAR